MVFCWRRRGEERRGKVAQKLFSFAANSRAQESAEQRPGAPFPPIPFVPSIPSIPSIPSPAAHLGGRGTARGITPGIPPGIPEGDRGAPQRAAQGTRGRFFGGEAASGGSSPPPHRILSALPGRCTGCQLIEGPQPPRFSWPDFGRAGCSLGGFWRPLPGSPAAASPGRAGTGSGAAAPRGCPVPSRPVPSRPVPSRSPGAGTVGQGGGEVKALTNCKHLVAFFECIYYHISRGV